MHPIYGCSNCDADDSSTCGCCPACGQPANHRCVACQSCACDRHDTCVRPTAAQNEDRQP